MNVHMHEISFKSLKHLCRSLERQYPCVEEGGLGKNKPPKKGKGLVLNESQIGGLCAKAARVCCMDNVGIMYDG